MYIFILRSIVVHMVKINLPKQTNTQKAAFHYICSKKWCFFHKFSSSSSTEPVDLFIWLQSILSMRFFLILSDFRGDCIHSHFSSCLTDGLFEGSIWSMLISKFLKSSERCEPRTAFQYLFLMALPVTKSL